MYNSCARDVEYIPKCVAFPDVLTEADLRTLVNLLDEVADRWHDLCLQLGVPNSTLRSIEARPLLLTGAPKTWLREGLSTWLESGASQQSCTISALCDALRQPSLDEGVLADQVQLQLNNRSKNHS